jgi:arabinoxylan arabinofuranohydrolase
MNFILNKNNIIPVLIFVWAELTVCPLLVRAGNPIVPNIGLTDPHISIFGKRAYLNASHDASPQNKTYVMHDWWVWSSDDLVNWRKESILKPEETYLKLPLKSCWDTFCVTKNNKYYWYLSTGSTNISVVMADTPVGPWKDPIGKPLIDETMTPAPKRDPDILIDDDGKAYMIFGAGRYYVVRLNEDMILLA